MKATIIFTLFFLVNGCKKENYFKEVISNKKVSLSIGRTFNKKNLVLNIPLEFKLFLNQKNVKDVRIYFRINNKRLIPAEEYMVLNGKTNKIIYAIEDIEYPNYPKSILLHNRINFISNEDALALIKKYNPNAILESLKTENDTIYLESYSKFRTSEFNFLNEMRIVPDTISLSIGFSGGKQKVFKERINW